MSPRSPRHDYPARRDRRPHGGDSDAARPAAASGSRRAGRELVRTFIALFLPAEVLRAIADTVEARKETVPDVRWTGSANVHLTLRFLGDVEAARLDGLAEALRAAAEGTGVLRMGLGAAGAFPQARAPRVVWIGLTGNVPGLTGFATRLETELRRRGYGRADKPFAPHLTIGRVRPPAPPHDWPALLAGLRFPRLEFTIAEAVVVKSELSPAGSRYTPLATVPLGAATPEMS